MSKSWATSSLDLHLDPAGPRAHGAELRQALAGYLAGARGVPVTPDRVVICSGFTQGLGLLCHVLRTRGATTLAMEAYGLQEHREIATASGLRMELADQRAVVLTPAPQFPLGAALAPRWRTQAVAWAAGTAGVVIDSSGPGG